MAKDESIKDKIAQGYILTRIIVEVIGSPKEHVDKIMKLVVEDFKKHKDIKPVKEFIESAEKEENEQYFHTFAELEFLAKNMYALVGVCIDLTPSSVEVIEPSEIKVTSKNLSDFLNDFSQKLHQIGMTSKNESAKAQLMEKSFNNLLLNTVYLLLRSKSQNLEFLSKYTGVKKELLKRILDNFVVQGKLNSENGFYSIKR